MHQILHDPIDVVIEFVQQKIRPRYIRWDGVLFEPTSVNLIHRSKEGMKHVFYFSVSDSNHFMKLRFDTENLSWHLVEFYADS